MLLVVQYRILQSLLASLEQVSGETNREQEIDTCISNRIQNCKGGRAQCQLDNQSNGCQIKQILTKNIRCFFVIDIDSKESSISITSSTNVESKQKCPKKRKTLRFTFALESRLSQMKGKKGNKRRVKRKRKLESQTQSKKGNNTLEKKKEITQT